MDLQIRGKTAVITGGTSGLGLASAEALAAEGVNLILIARSAAKFAPEAEALAKRHGISVHVESADVTDRDQMRALAERLAAAGGMDILLVNTPRPPSPMRAFLDETDDDRWDMAARNQLDAALNILRFLTPLMLDRGWGRVIGLTSASVKQPMPRHAVSTIFRAGMQAAMKHLVDELAPHNITVNCIAPATVVTPTFSQFHNLERRISEIPLKRAGKSSELGALVAFLASDHAGFLTGQVLQLDGGMTRSLV